MIHLHCHSEYSLLDGHPSVEELVKKAASLGQSAIAITDHGNMSGVLEFYTACQRHGIKPIVGCEVYIVPDRTVKDKKLLKEQGIVSQHLTLLAMNQVGYHNLIQIVTDAHLTGFYYKPRTDKSVLTKHNEGIIALSGCLQGEIPMALRADDPDAVASALAAYLAIFGDRFYLEMQANTLVEQDLVNRNLITIARETGVPLVVTCDVHYANAEDADAHDILLAISTGKKLDDKDRMTFNATDFYVQSQEEILERLHWNPAHQDANDIAEAITNTHRVADRIDLTLQTGQALLPTIEVPVDQTPQTYLSKLCIAGLFSLAIREDIDEEIYMQRLEYELSVIGQRDLATYMLIVYDFVTWARENGIAIGPGRGSSAGSLIAYLLNITSVDPIKYGLLFERFINPERPTLPDIDIDFCYNNRHRVIEYLSNKYGKDKVANVSTFGTMAARTAIDMVATAMGMPFKDRKLITKCVPAATEITIELALEESSALQEYATQHPDLFSLARRIEGRRRHSSTHACGITISPSPLTDVTALRYTEGSQGDVVTHFDMETLETLGAIKFDILGLKTITAIDTVLHAVNLDLHDIPMDDETTFTALCSGHLAGIFQVERPWAANILRRLKPEHILHIADAVALLRPGPLESGATDMYIERRNNLKRIEYAHPDLQSILNQTFGVLVYQEQIMQIAGKFAGYTAGEQDGFRKGVGKKIKEVVLQELEAFSRRALERGYEPEIIQKLVDDITKHARYSFNKSHAVAYAMISYITAYLKTYYPVEYMAALMSTERDKPDKVYEYLMECRRLGITILPPDINNSDYSFKVEGGNIRFCLSSIKGVGTRVVQALLEARGDTPFTDINDLYQRINKQTITRASFTALIQAGALDSFGKNRNLLLKEYYIARQQDYKDKGVDVPNMPETTSQQDIMMWEQERLGTYISTHPTDIEDDGSWLLTANGEEVNACGIIVKCVEILTKHKEDMSKLSLDTPCGIVPVVVFPREYKKFKQFISQTQKIAVHGTKRDGSLIADKITRRQSHVSQQQCIQSTKGQVSDDRDGEDRNPTGNVLENSI